MAIAPIMMTISDAAENRDKKTEDEPQPAEEFADGDKIRQRARRPSFPPSSARPSPAECAEQLLRTVRGKDDTDDHTQQKQGNVHSRTIGRRGLFVIHVYTLFPSV